MPPPPSQNPVYNWSPQTQGIILSSVTYGMLITQVPVGYLSGIYPVKNMVGSALLLSSLLSLLTPLAAGVGESAVIACRVAQGLSQVREDAEPEPPPAHASVGEDPPLLLVAGDGAGGSAHGLDQVGASAGTRPTDLPESIR